MWCGFQEEPPAKRRKYKSWSETQIRTFFQIKNQFGLDNRATLDYVLHVLPNIYDGLKITTVDSWLTRLGNIEKKRKLAENEKAQVISFFFFLLSSSSFSELSIVGAKKTRSDSKSTTCWRGFPQQQQTRASGGAHAAGLNRHGLRDRWSAVYRPDCSRPCHWSLSAE
jgi:hypothetical protein